MIETPGGHCEKQSQVRADPLRAAAGGGGDCGLRGAIAGKRIHPYLGFTEDAGAASASNGYLRVTRWGFHALLTKPPEPENAYRVGARPVVVESLALGG